MQKAARPVVDTREAPPLHTEGAGYRRKFMPERGRRIGDEPPTYWLYLHGFGSSPKSKKAEFFRKKFSAVGIPFFAPDLNIPSFREMTISAILSTIDDLIRDTIPDDGKIGIIGSGLGGVIAVHTAARHRAVKRLLLLAPSFALFRETFLGLGRVGVKLWEKDGSAEVYNAALDRSTRISSDFLVDARNYDENQVRLSIPITIVHGESDEHVDPQVSIVYARNNPNVRLHLVDDDHSLILSAQKIWEWLWQDIRPHGPESR